MTGETSLYRRHRPQAFDEVVGQEHVVRTLRNAVERDRVHHAYLFVGSRGTGKTSLAKILARSLNCVNGPTVTPCGECESCVSIAAGSSIDVIEMDAASNRSVDDIRDLRERVGYAPALGHWKVYILDEAHMLTREAWNAFLKTLEEPPPNTVFILATTEPHKVMPTIVDRCQRFDFQRPSLEQIAEVLSRVSTAEEIEIEHGAIAAIARAASGSFRDALGTLDQLVSYGGKSVNTEDVLAVLGVADAELILAATDAIAAADGRLALEASSRLASSGHDVTQFARDLLAHLRQLIVIKTIGEPPDSFAVTAADSERLRVQADSLSELALGRSIDILSSALTAIREGDEPRMTVELALLRAARPQLDPSKEALLQRIERLEAGAGGAVSDPAPAAAAPAAEAADGPSPRMSSPTPPTPADTENPAEDAPTATAVADLPLEKVVDLWPAVIDQVRRSGAELLSHVLAAARPVSVDARDRRLEVGFPASAAFNKRKAEANEARERCAEALLEVVGERLRPVYVLLDSDDEAAAPVESSLTEEELIELVRTEFDAEEYMADPDDGEAEAKEA
ncbi:MAG TPA: DNA polymerase III subunit gamma/tau [Solirubrobacterales bacterium]|nr:DNA polymerase III subunit gamma/tau [Solirubrobacterales bacterium]